jgi:hypothetical protein
MVSCGYRWEPDYPSSHRPSVAVPFATGDDDGSLTYEIVQALSSSGLVDVKRSEADYRLQVAVTGLNYEPIGYRRDRQKITGEIIKQLTACEGRKMMAVEVTLYEGNSDRIAYGPYQITDDTDYDYVDGDSIQDLAFINREGNFTVVLPFSLGQLESVEAAQEAATRPLYQKIAQKIVDVISSEW